MEKKYSTVLLAGNGIYRRIKSMEMSDQERSRITRRMELLLELITDLQSRDIEDLPGPAMSALDDVLDRIESCEKICESTKKQNKLTQFIKVSFVYMTLYTYIHTCMHKTLSICLNRQCIIFACVVASRCMSMQDLYIHTQSM